MKKTICALILGATLTGCFKEAPYRPIQLSTLKNEVTQQVVVQGIPSLVRDHGFVLRDNNNEVYVSRQSFGDFLLTGDYKSAKSALERTIKETPNEQVKVYGKVLNDKTIEANYVDIKGTLYPIYN